MTKSATGWALVALLMCSGCAAEEPLEKPETTELRAPRVSTVGQVSYEVAEDKARDLLERYLRLTDTITSEEGQRPERIGEVVSAEWLTTELRDFERYRVLQERTIGATSFDSLVLQVARVTVEDTLDVSVFACVDSTGVFVLGPGVPDPPAEVMAWHPHYDDFAGSEEERIIIDTYFLEHEVRFGQRQPVVFWLSGENLDSLVIDSQEQWWGEHPC